MKSLKILSIYLLATLLFQFSCNSNRDFKEVTFNCGTMKDFDKRITTDSLFRNSLERLEEQTNEYLNRLKETNFSDFRSTVVTIPVVVHVVYKNPTENISLAKIQSQIDALNNFYRRLNSDISTVPVPFNGLSSDIMIEFVLAQRDPNCLPTNGVTRTPTTVTSFTNDPDAVTPQSRNPVKFNSSGGADGWPSDQYLNLWSCDLSGTLIGYASFPSEMATSPNEDGVVMDFMSFGTVPPVTAGLDLGRVCCHEVGHWLNLRHIWGDDIEYPVNNSSNDCTGTDFVADTPNEEGPNNSCPAFPRTDLCTTTSPGVMFMNQMDYTSDACRRLFTIGQSDRMAATLFTVRNSLLSSQGGIAVPPGLMGDLWIKDSDEDLGNEPNIESSFFYLSDDIWVRNSNDGLINQETQNPQGGGTNFVYVRIRNRSCSPTVAGAQVKLYWAKASTGLSWPQPWDGTVILTGTTLMGNLINTQTLSSISGNNSIILTFQWNNTPDPSDYNSLGADLLHFCLLARIEESTGMAIPEIVGDLGGNVRNNNNIGWKNISINDTDGSGFTNTLISNYTKDGQLCKVTFDAMNNQNYSRSKIPFGLLYANFDKILLEQIENKSVNVTGFEKTTDGYLLKGLFGTIEGIKLNPGQHYVVGLKFVPYPDYLINRFVYEVNITQTYEKTQTILGGQLIKFKYQK